MNYKTIVLDIDGTILDDELRIPSKTVNLLKTIHQKGVSIIFCTGRMLDSAHHIINKYFGTDQFPIVSYNGSLITIPGEEKPIFHHFIDHETATKIIEFLRSKGCHRQAYINNQLIAEEDNEQIKNYAVHAGIDYLIVKSLTDLIQPNGKKNGEKIDKILAIGQPEFLNEIEKESLKLFSNKVNIFKSFSIYLDYIPNTTNKGIATLELLQYLNLDPKQTIMIGDGDNDIYAFEVVGYSIAMANATPKLKKAATLCLDKTNNEEGVYHILNHLYSDLFH